MSHCCADSQGSFDGDSSTPVSTMSSPAGGCWSPYAAHHLRTGLPLTRTDHASMPHACNRGSGINLEFLFRRAHSRRRVECRYWSGWSSSCFTASSNEVTVGTTGPSGTGLPQFGLPFLPILCLSLGVRLLMENSVGENYTDLPVLKKRFKSPCQTQLCAENNLSTQALPLRSYVSAVTQCPLV